MQFVSAVCMQAMNHSVDNVPSQQAVKLVVRLGFVEPCVALDCFWESPEGIGCLVSPVMSVSCL